MSDTVTIVKRFIGPPTSVNGGYACGVTARALTDGPAEASLRLPPPIERPLRIEVSEDTSALYDGAALVAEAHRAELDLNPPEPISFREAETAAESFDLVAYRDGHPFPGCFTCGPDRADGDGLRIFPGRVNGADAVAWPWIPDQSLDDGSGAVDPLYLWAALDCPSGLAWIYDPEPQTPHVLGRLAVQIHRAPEIGERTVAAGWLREATGRKKHSGSAIWSAHGELLAVGQATWIALSEEQLARFSVAGG